MDVLLAVGGETDLHDGRHSGKVHSTGAVVRNSSQRVLKTQKRPPGTHVTSLEKRMPVVASLNVSAAALRWLWLLREWISHTSTPRLSRLKSAAARPVARAVGRNAMIFIAEPWIACSE